MKLVFSFILVFISLIYYSQSTVLQLANDLKSQFKDETYVGTSSNVNHSFRINSKTNKVEGIVKEDNTLIALKHRAKVEVYSFETNESQVNHFNVFSGKNLKALINVEKHCYSNFSEDIFSSDLIACQHDFTINSFGEKIRYKTKTTYKDVKYLAITGVTEDFPILEKTITYRIPNWLNIRFHEVNFEGIDYKKSEIFDEKKKEKIITYTFQNLRGVIDEENSFGFTWLEPHIVPIFNSYTNSEGERTNILGSIEDMYKWYKKLTDNVDNKNDSLAELVENLTVETNSEMDIAKSIFYWVQDNIKYIAFEDGIMGFQPDAAYNVYNKRYGDCKGMANLTKNMLKLAGLDARLTWVGTTHVSDKYNYSFPSLMNDNHMICTVIIDSTFYFLDPTENFISIGDYASRIQGRKVLIENGSNYLIKKVPSFNHEHNKKEITTSLSIDDENLVGKSHISFQGEAKTGILWGIDALRRDNRSETLARFLSSGNTNIIIYKHSHSDITNRHIPLTFDVEFAIENHIIQTNEKIYVSICLNNDFDYIAVSDKRKSDFNLNYKPCQVEMVELQVPEGYKLDYLPKSVIVSNEEYEIDYSYENSGSTIKLIKEIKFKTGIITLDNMKNWNIDLKRVKTFNADQIVFSKN